MDKTTNKSAGEALDLNKLEALAKAATPQNFDSAQITNQGCIECPSCDGSGEVELTADYCNYDGRAIGVQFYGIGPEHRAAEAFYRAANPAAILELIALARVGSAAPAAPTAEQIANVILRLIGECAMDWRAGPTGNDEDDAFSSDDEELRVLVGLVNKALTAPTAAEGPSEQDAWISVEDQLPEKECLAVYVTPNGKQRLIRAKYARQFQIEAEGDDCETEYNEDDDTFYIKAGWLECIDNWGEYSSCYVTEGTVTHWKPSPALPAIAAQPKDTTDTRRDA